MCIRDSYYFYHPYGKGGAHTTQILNAELQRLNVQRIGRIEITDLVKDGDAVSGAVGFHAQSGKPVYIRARAVRHLEKGRVVIFGCGVGCPFFSTDTAAVLRAAEIGADVILLAKNIDGVYDCDPAKNANAVKFDAITYDEVLKRRLAVMDSTATSLSMDNHIPVLVFALKDPYNIVRALRGEKIGTIVKEA